MKVICHSVPVDIQDHLNGMVLLQNCFNSLPGICISFASVQLSIYQVIDRFIVVYLISPRLQKFCQTFSHCYHRLTRAGVRESFLRMGVVNQNLRSFPIFIYCKVFFQQFFRVHQVSAGSGGSMDIVEIFH